MAWTITDAACSCVEGLRAIARWPLREATAEARMDGRLAVLSLDPVGNARSLLKSKELPQAYRHLLTRFNLSKLRRKSLILRGRIEIDIARRGGNYPHYCSTLAELRGKNRVTLKELGVTKMDLDAVFRSGVKSYFQEHPTAPRSQEHEKYLVP